VKSPDTEVLVLYVHYFPKMKNTSELWFQTGLITSTKDCRRYIPVHELCKSLSSVVCKNMLFKCIFTRDRSKYHQSRIFDSCQFYPQFVQIDMASFRLSLCKIARSSVILLLPLYMKLQIFQIVL
jgi:hypothetical protein